MASWVGKKVAAAPALAEGVSWVKAPTAAWPGANPPGCNAATAVNAILKPLHRSPRVPSQGQGPAAMASVPAARPPAKPGDAEPQRYFHRSAGNRLT